MNTPVQNPQSIYYPTKENKWTGVNWSKVEKTIETLQHRITKAAERGDHRQLRNLQRLLNRSLSARLKAVQIVTQENSGKETPGIDGIVWTNSNRKHQAVLELRKRSPTKPLRPVYMPKSHGKQGLLRILCMSDRARQALWNMALLPFLEAISDSHSYKFRPDGGCWDANAQIRQTLSHLNSPTWVLNANIEKCVDQINHDWLLENTPMETKVLKGWLKAGYLQEDQLFSTTKSISEGKIISLTLANLTLNGLEEYLEKTFCSKLRFCSSGKSSTQKPTKINVIRYADDFIITGRSKPQLEMVKLSINTFLKCRGFKINEEKTSIRHISEGFDFLGWNFRKYSNDTLVCKISQDSISRHRKEIKYLTKTIHDPEILIPQLNNKIRGWMTYNYCCNGIWKVWSSMNQYLYRCLLKWGQRRHSNKTQKWIFNKYWKHINGRWTFNTPSKTDNDILLTLDSYNVRQKTNLNKAK